MANSAWQKEALHQNATDRPYIRKADGSGEQHLSIKKGGLNFPRDKHPRGNNKNGKRNPKPIVAAFFKASGRNQAAYGHHQGIGQICQEKLKYLHFFTP